MSKLKPVGNRILLKAIEEKETVIGGIYVPEASKKKSDRAKVISVSSSSEIKEGDIVILAKYGGTEVKIDGETYLIASEEDILAAIEENT